MTIMSHKQLVYMNMTSAVKIINKSNIIIMYWQITSQYA